MIVPFVDLKAQYQSLKPAMDAAVVGVMASSDFILGKAVSDFEAQFAAFVGTKYCIGVASGTDALHLILRSLGIGPGDEVITVTNTFIATVQAISLAGALPVLVDCEPETALMDLECLAKAISPRTKAVMPVHLYGQAVNIAAIRALCEPRGIVVIEDAAQAHGASAKPALACGAQGLAGAFSFYPGKNLGAYGDGGAVTTNDAALAERLRLYRNWGSVVKYHHEVKGLNARLDTLQAAVLLVKLPHLAAWNEARRQAAARYRTLLAELPGVRPLSEGAWSDRHVYHLFVVRISGPWDRKAVLAALAGEGISAGVHYPVPVHLQPAYQDLGYPRGAFPVAEAMAGELLSLPIFPEITEAQQRAVVTALRRHLGR